MERLTELEMSSIGLAILCNFPRFCGEERAKEASDMFRTMRIKIMAYRALGPVEELSTLVKAQDEGRVVVLPCKFGGTLYRVRRFTRGENWRKQAAFVQPIELTMNNVVKIVFGGELGKTVFLTRAEAEAALSGGAERG